MPDAQIHPIGDESAPADYIIPAGAELLLKGVYAKFDGTGAAGSYLPLVRIISDAGSTVIEAVSDTTIAAGASADASWFPHLGGGSGSGTGATPAASAYLWTQTPHTFTGTSGFSATWAHFQTTDTSVFGTLPFNSFAPPPTNQPGDVNLLLLKDGLYAVSASAVWASGTANFYGQVQVPHADYLTDGKPTAIGDLPTTTPAMSTEGELMSYDVQLFTLPQTWAPTTIFLLLEGQTATNYTVNQWSLVCHWFGSGIGADDVVY
jgi:hypothetical protein